VVKDGKTNERKRETEGDQWVEESAESKRESVRVCKANTFDKGVCGLL
jgi:hypothetical protein